ncbi:nuclear pore protein 84/107 [Coemansia reversa NRRL 1564]|uniref:Nuclear pore complex protein n=1 Tax=Coemansia reversa (strain ATCC 12441 / NRRL 1564) TaxID=763665 RepID=A0A2G5B4M5_COERN|nr:nuclear pore protein 84/107 [Coemansia reversa NRRL 1564]|eukprot:PIA13952.1 nuclear pore protein 84/107 [Coemansia reversa NRRL 1564]
MSASDIAVDFAAVVESGSGSKLAARAFGKLARQQCDSLDRTSVFGSDADSTQRKGEVEYWSAESNTWDLLERLYSLRQQANQSDTNSQSETTMQTAGVNTAATAFTSVQELMAANNLLSEYVEVRRWLEETAPAFQPVETRKGYLFYTRRGAKERGLLAAGELGSEGRTGRIVTEVDPDATSRQRKDLAFEDAEYETSLLRTLYEYVRRGRVGNAMDLCVESDEPWRAASLKGGLLWRDPMLEPANDMPVDTEDGADVVDVRPPHTAGNINRALWKHACAALAHDENNDIYERALYAALSGRLDEAVLVCGTWEDFLWAYVNSMIESYIDQAIKDARGLYIAAETTSFDHVQSKYPPVSNMKHVFGTIASHDSGKLQQESNEPFRMLQKALITDSFDEYLTEFSHKLRNEVIDENELGLLRFVVHAALCLRQLGFSLSSEAVSILLETYIGCLAKGHRELVAAYVSHMPNEEQTESYAQFLQHVSDPFPVRMQLLKLAENHRLDIDAISKRTTELLLRKYASSQSSEPNNMDTEVSRFGLAEPSEPITDAELGQVRAIEWITSSTRLYEHALVEVCKLARQFLLAGRTNAATRLFNSLPDNFVQPDWVKGSLSTASGSDHPSPSSGSTNVRSRQSERGSDGAIASYFQEYIHLFSLCDAYAYYSTWAESLCKRPAEATSKAARLQIKWLEWKENIAQITNHAVQMFRGRLLDIDWLCPQSLAIGETDPEADADIHQERMEELVRLRELYIPETVFRLHSILFDTRDAVPQNLKRSLDLAQLVADESLGIYRQLAKASPLHPQGRLPAFMNLMRRSAFEILRIQQESQPNKPPLLADTATIASGIA